MKKVFVALTALAVLALCVGLTTNDASAAKPKCTTIQQGILTYSPTHLLFGTPLTTGYDPYGYNYQAVMFNGTYANSYLGAAGFPPYNGDDAAYLTENPTAASFWAWPYRNDNLAMKWNEAWLSNKDCDGDGKLDRHLGFPTYKDSGAWLTNHQSGTYEDGGNVYFWNYFVKIVAVSSKDTLVNGVWFDKKGVEIGPSIWGDFAIIQEVNNDTGTGDHGIGYRSPAGPGLGKW